MALGGQRPNYLPLLKNILMANIVTTSKALVTSSDALVPSSFLLLVWVYDFKYNSIVMHTLKNISEKRPLHQCACPT